MGEQTTTADLAIRVIGCPYCGVPYGSRCVTSRGRRTTVHIDRLRPVIVGWRKGYAEGLRDAVADPAWAARAAEASEGASDG